MITLLLLFYFVSKYNQYDYGTSVMSHDILPYKPFNLRTMDRESQRRLLVKIYKDQCPKGYTIAFKGFRSDMTCLDFHYIVGKRYILDCEPICCQRGFHACLYLRDCIWYYGESTDVYHVVFVKDFVNSHGSDSKICAKEIIIGPRIYLK